MVIENRGNGGARAPYEAKLLKINTPLCLRKHKKRAEGARCCMLSMQGCSMQFSVVGGSNADGSSVASVESNGNRPLI